MRYKGSVCPPKMLLAVVRCYIKNVTKLSQFYLDCWLHSQRKCIKVSSVGSYTATSMKYKLFFSPTIYCGYFSLRDLKWCCWKTENCFVYNTKCNCISLHVAFLTVSKWSQHDARFFMFVFRPMLFLFSFASVGDKQFLIYFFLKQHIY